LNPGLDLVIFDCDGVLVDSERVANEVFARVLREVCDLHFTLEDMFDTFVGHSRLQCLQKIEALTGEPPPAELDLRYQQDINQALASSVEAIAGIETVLEQLSLPCCVASSGSHEKMQMTLGKTGLLDYFDGNIFSTNEVDAPDPARCLVIEDSPIGVSGAVAAGMTVFGFAELMPAHKLQASGAHLVFERMHSLPDLIVNHATKK
jgi:HAD superfamily hydrolase (TIGR01509 family)